MHALACGAFECAAVLPCCHGRAAHNTTTDLTFIHKQGGRILVCGAHAVADSFNVNGVASRFCGKHYGPHPLSAFSGTRRECDLASGQRQLTRAKRKQKLASGLISACKADDCEQPGTKVRPGRSDKEHIAHCTKVT